ncbi:hypothetical protein, partial [Enterococcus cecorum]|uniref:hypothetical protein n=3 Tax=Enterococcus cecorum TaxID=44008 RepID=UPI001C0EB02C
VILSYLIERSFLIKVVVLGQVFLILFSKDILFHSLMVLVDLIIEETDVFFYYIDDKKRYLVLSSV